MEWSESRYELREGRDDQEDSPMKEQYDDLEQVGTDKSSKRRSKDRKSSSRGEDKEHRSKDHEKLNRSADDLSKEREKEPRDPEKDRTASRERKREDRDEREKDRSKDSKVREKDYDREKYRDKDRERDKDKKDRGKDKDREKEREMEKDTDRGREKERGKEKTRDRDREKEKERDKAKEREREKHRDREKERESHRDGEKDKGKDKIRDKDKEADQDKERSRDRDRVSRKTHEEDHGWSKDDDHKVDYHEKRDGEVGKQGKASNLDEGEQNGEALAHTSAMELEERVLKMREARLSKQSEGAFEILAWVNKSRKLEEKKKAEKEKALQLSKIFEEQDNIQEESEDEDTTQHAADNLAGAKVLHGLDKVMEGGTVVLTIKDQPILADGDINQDVDMLENVEIGEQKRRDEAYKAAKKKTGIYDDKFNDDPTAEKKILPQYDDPAAEEGLTLDGRGRFSSEAEKKLEELRRRITGVSTNTFEDLNSSGKVSSDYYTHEEMLQFKKPKKKKSPQKKEKLDLNALEAEAVSAGLGAGDLGSRNDSRMQAIKEEQERLEAEKRNTAYQSAYAKADEASRFLEQTLNMKAEEVVFTAIEEFVWGLQIDEEARKPESEDVFMHEEKEENALDEGKNDETGGWTEVKETSQDEKPAAVGKGLAGALKLLKDRGTLKETVEWGGRNMDKKKSKLVGILDDDESKDARNKKEIRIERTDEFGRIVTPKEAFRMHSHKFHGKGPGKMKQEKRMKQYYEELKIKQMKASDTPSLSVERMRESQVRLKTPYLVLSGHAKLGETSDPKSGFATVEKDLPGGLTPMLGDQKVEHFLGIKRKAEPRCLNTPKKPKS